jgi:hypothetical protein
MCRSYYQLQTDSMRRQFIPGKFILLHFIFLFNATDLWPTYIKTVSAFRISHRTSSTQRRSSSCRLSWNVWCNYSPIVHENVLREIFVRNQNKWERMKVCFLFLTKIFINILNSTHNSDCLVACTYYITSFQVYVTIQCTVFTIITTCFNNKKLRIFFRKYCFFLLWFLQTTTTAFLYTLSRLICVNETWCVFCGIKTEYRYNVNYGCPCLQHKDVWQAVSINLHTPNVDTRRRYAPAFLLPKKVRARKSYLIPARNLTRFLCLSVSSWVTIPLTLQNVI